MAVGKQSAADNNDNSSADHAKAWRIDQQECLEKSGFPQQIQSKNLKLQIKKHAQVSYCSIHRGKQIDNN